ncbi:MAG TPA: DUF3467 domain-containing protein [Candidatus Sphingobacterium stercoripullorum]|uniref:DUF3467 domain-containing protein n=1 Tax=Candidatus Sphingobacterium stercoripullorum TaxID=2838759 RepID=A0A9D1W6W9_9SPHI|nr:DUF3467 domain-containing protein [Candidatus Sphingobacterium stercoripullorum]HLR50446.1 DUF3467 domain-containing protein [Candidatus Sphingobacterium stercoripullorum]
MSNKNKPNEDSLNFELTEEVALGKYSNLAVITHSSSEFVVDFASVLPGIESARVHSRIVMAPEHAKRLLRAIEDNIRQFEAMNGPIEIEETPPFPMGFTPNAEA